MSYSESKIYQFMKVKSLFHNYLSTSTLNLKTLKKEEKYKNLNISRMKRTVKYKKVADTTFKFS